jgi:hypothetical protein
LSFSCSLPFFIFVVAIATSTVVLSLVYIHSLAIDSSSQEKDRYITARAISIHDIGNSGTSTGITNSIRKNEIGTDQADGLADSNPSIQLSSTKTTNNKKEGRDIMQREQQSGSSFAETQFYARTSHTPTNKRHDLIYQKSDEIYSTPPIEDTFHDAIDDLNTNKDQIIDDKSKKICIFLFVSFIRYASENKMSLHFECECIIVDLFHMNSFTRASTNLTILSVSANGDPQFFFLSSLSHVKCTQRRHTIIKHAYAGHKLVPDI